MAALTENALIEYRRTGRLAIPVAAAVEIFKGAHVNVRGGYAVPADDTADDSYAGFAEEPADNTDGENGDITVLVNTTDELLCTGVGFAQDDVGQDVFILDDATVGLAADSTNLVKVGKISEFKSATEIWVDQRRQRLIVVPQEVADATTPTNENGDIGGLTVTGEITPQVADGAIAALTSSATTTQAEFEALRDKCEDLAEDMILANNVLAAHETEVEAVIAATEVLADDFRADHTTLAAVIAALKAQGILIDP